MGKGYDSNRCGRTVTGIIEYLADRGISLSLSDGRVVAASVDGSEVPSRLLERIAANEEVLAEYLPDPYDFPCSGEATVYWLNHWGYRAVEDGECNKLATWWFEKRGQSKPVALCTEHVSQVCRIVGGTIIPFDTLDADMALWWIPFFEEARVEEVSPREYLPAGALFIPNRFDYRPYLLGLQVLRLARQAGPDGVSLRELEKGLRATRAAIEGAIRLLTEWGKIADAVRRPKQGPATRVWVAVEEEPADI
jgi:hypothetical protein